MDDSNPKLELSDAYRSTVKNAALRELERLQLDAATLTAMNQTPAALERKKNLDRDRMLAEQYCRDLGIDFQTMFAVDMDLEIKRLKRIEAAGQLVQSMARPWFWLRSISLSSALFSALSWTPLSVFLFWSVTHVFVIGQVFQLAAAYLGAAVFMLLLALPTTLIFEQRRQLKIHEMAPQLTV